MKKSKIMFRYSVLLFMIGLTAVLFLEIFEIAIKHNYNKHLPAYINRILGYILLLIPIMLITSIIGYWDEAKKLFIDFVKLK